MELYDSIVERIDNSKQYLNHTAFWSLKKVAK